MVVENFKPGTLEGWGLGWSDLSRANPRLVMVRISGFGQDGPYASRPGYGVICEAVSGLRHLTGDPDRPPSRVAVSMTDYITGLHAAFGAVMALMARATTGRGQYVDAALYECAFNFMEPWIPAYEKLGHIANRTGSRLAESTPNNLYPTGDGDFIHITAMADSLFRRLAEAMGQPDLAEDPRFAKALERNRNSEALDRIIAEWTTTQPLAEIERKLAGGRRAGNPHLYHRRHLQGPALRRAALDRRCTCMGTWGRSPWPAWCRGFRRPRARSGTRAAPSARTRAPCWPNCSAMARDKIAGLERSGVIACASPTS